MDIVGAPHRDGCQRRKIARQRIGPNGFTLDDAGVAVAGLATRRFAIDQHDRPASALQMQRGGDPDHSGAENDNASHCHDYLFQPVASNSYIRWWRKSSERTAHPKCKKAGSTI